MKKFATLSFCAGMALMVLPLAACSTTGTIPPTGTSGTITIVAGENFWGSIASQLGGSKVNVTSIVTDPNADPHEYEVNTNDARIFATARYVILNGAGYDTWAQKVLDANPESKRTVFTVADLLGKKEGDNPHFWYNPTYVEQVSDKITADLKSIDPGDASYFAQQRTAFENALVPYHARIAEIASKFAGQKVSATESIFVYMAAALNLDLVSPPDFMEAIAEGNDPPAASVAEFQTQLTTKQTTVLVYNVQTVTPVTENMKKLAVNNGIPTVAVSETMQPPDAQFQDWMTAELLTLQNALNQNVLAN